MKQDKIISFILCLIMLIGLFPTGSIAFGASEPPVFSDMPTDWSTQALENAITNGILNGSNGKIFPNDNLTRAEMSAVMVRAFGATAMGDISVFSDVSQTDWFATDIAKAYQMDIIKGSNGKMNPENSITREEVFVIMARALKLKPAETLYGHFTDVGEISSWARGEVYALANEGYISGSGGKLDPGENITRAQFAKALDNIITHYISIRGQVSQIGEGNVMVNVAGVTLKDITINGDLIIGDGVGDGEVTLDNVEVKGRMVVRGGGENSIIIKGSSDISNIIVCRIDGKISIKVQGNANVEIMYIDDGSDDVIIEGDLGNVKVEGEGINIYANNANIGSLSMAGPNSTLSVGSNSTITNVTIYGRDIGVNVSAGSEITDMTINNNGATVSGAGQVGTVAANGNDITVTTPGTSVTAGSGTTGVTAGTTAVSGGTTTTIPSASTGGGGGGTSSGSSTVTVSSLSAADVTITSGSIVFAYTFQSSGGAVTYGNAKLAPYYLNVASSTVTLKNATSSTSAVSLQTLGIADNGSVSYSAITDIQNKFSGLTFTPTQVAIHLVGASSVNAGADEWTTDVAIDLDAGEMALLAPPSNATNQAILADLATTLAAVSFSTTQGAAGTTTTALAVAQGTVNSYATGYGATATATAVVFTAATAPSTDGSLTFTVELSKGTGGELATTTTGILAMTIEAVGYSSDTAVSCTDGSYSITVSSGGVWPHGYAPADNPISGSSLTITTATTVGAFLTKLTFPAGSSYKIANISDPATTSPNAIFDSWIFGDIVAKGDAVALQANDILHVLAADGVTRRGYLINVI
ncbi:MAG: S-layer homology domain-containing protein [Clostridia bacterium]|nr:S-layer homology domain-containing protein [Clostridia bacterium]